MSDIKNHVVDLETAKKLILYLPEGFTSLHAWLNIDGEWKVANGSDNIPDGLLGYSAPLITEITPIFPRIVRFDRCILLSCDLMHYDKCERLCELRTFYTGYGGNIGCVCANNRFQWNIPFFLNAKNESENDINEATAAAQLYVWLKERGYV